MNNSILRHLQKNRFSILVLIVLFFSFTFAFMVRTTLVAFFTEASSTSSTLLKAGNGNMPLDTNSADGRKDSMAQIALDQIDSLVEGNLIRGSNAKEAILNTPPKTAMNTSPEIASMLVAGTVSGNQSFARAVIKAKDKEEAEEYRVGQKLGDWKILRIDWHSITLGAANSSFTVEIGETIEDAMKKRLPQDDSIPDEFSKERTAISHKPTTLSRTDIDRILKNPITIYENAKFGPNIENGKINGMKIYQVARVHIFSQLGAESGDIIKRVNGMPLGETEKMLEIWSAVKVAQKIQVDLDRKGEIHTYTFLVRN
jgi:general secretion pathway protein C